MRYLLLTAIAATFLSCSVKNQPTGNTTRPPEHSDAETIDTITIDTDDPLVTPSTFIVSRWPRQYETFSGHFVIFVDSLSPRVAEITFLSLTDWPDIYSANSADYYNQAIDTASYYSELGLAQWSIPTETQARRMKSDLNIDILNARIQSNTSLDSSTSIISEDARYLCQQATKTFSFAPNTNVTTAGAKTQYHLRLLRTQRIAKPL